MRADPAGEPRPVEGEPDDVSLTADGAFAVLGLEPGRVTALGAIPEEVRSLPGYFRAGGEVQAWLSPALKELIIAHGFRAAPALIEAIDAEVAHANASRPLATDLEIASSCADPEGYPPNLVQRLQQLGLQPAAGA